MTFHRVAQNLYRCDPHGTYYAVWHAHGAKHRKSLNTSDRQVANTRLPETLARERGLDHARRGITFAAAAAACPTLRSGKRKKLKPASVLDRAKNLKALYAAWPDLRLLALRDIKPRDCAAWRARRLHQISPQRLNNEIGTLKQVFDYAVAEGVLQGSPAVALRREPIARANIQIPERTDFANIVAALHKSRNAEAAWFVELMAYTGLRVNEAAHLCWSDIDFRRGWFTVTGGPAGTKSGVPRHVPLFPALRDLLDRIPRVLGRDRLFANNTCRHALANACDTLKLSTYTHHDFRHFFASNAIEEGIDFKTVGDWLGHHDGGILAAKTYGHLRAVHSENMAARMTYSAVAPSLAHAGKTQRINWPVTTRRSMTFSSSRTLPGHE